MAQKGKRGAINHYKLMTLEKIKAMPVADLIDEDVHCWLWVNNATLEVGFDVLHAWGFESKSIFTWVMPQLGLDNYLRNCKEHLLLGTRRKAPSNLRGK
ncbi:hypothetical protein LAX72_13695 [Listeria monocytogenes]|nr:hypothetical protein [Listeria monocytogenes]